MLTFCPMARLIRLLKIFGTVDAVSGNRQVNASLRYGYMEIILFRNDNIAANFEEALQASFPQFMAYTSLTHFCTQLRHTPTQGAIIVLAAADQKDLSTLMSIRHLFEDAPMILILPTKDAALLAKAHKLHPRFIGDLESGAHEVIAVIHKMLSRKKQAMETALSGPLKKLRKGVENGF